MVDLALVLAASLVGVILFAAGAVFGARVTSRAQRGLPVGPIAQTAAYYREDEPEARPATPTVDEVIAALKGSA